MRQYRSSALIKVEPTPLLAIGSTIRIPDLLKLVLPMNNSDITFSSEKTLCQKTALLKVDLKITRNYLDAISRTGVVKFSFHLVLIS